MDVERVVEPRPQPVIALSLGGFALSVTSIVDAWPRLKHHAGKLTRLWRQEI